VAVGWGGSVESSFAGAIEGVGVDLEFARPMHSEAARFFLTAGERRAVEELAAGQQPKTLLRLWTIKEALFKADPHNAGTALTDYDVGCVIDLDAGTAAVKDTSAGGESTIGGGASGKRTMRFLSLALPGGWLSFAFSVTWPAHAADGDDRCRV
jgi:hypothetical protein